MEIDIGKASTGEVAGTLVAQLGIVRALTFAEDVTRIVREDADAQCKALAAALGQPVTPARRERPAPQQRTPPATPEETVERVREELTRSKRSAKGLATIIHVPLAQVDAALKMLGAEKHGRTYSLKATT